MPSTKYSGYKYPRSGYEASVPFNYIALRSSYDFEHSPVISWGKEE